ncbi:uncharacterized protein LOC106873135 isoform X1 [Octopus bimaculoides]|uniref:uncharacterized protein LOC106873135 isoform X1 n=1 Tax=Octopus bimaculoides TaxID=37653 RepID=UPI0022E1BB24|nr:uncharacterized protein LOC106873135 isoform X1 [Octopus bimaculoides]
MAGGAVTMAEDFPIIENTIHGWIVGYYCDRILQEWSQSFEPWSTNHIKLGTYIDSISSVTSFNNEVQYKLELICWLPKLFRLEKQENEEPFLKIIQSLDAIKDIYPESFLEETTEFFTQLKKQCILLCSQEVGFVAAKNLSKKLASESKLNKEELLQQSRVLSSPSKRREDETGTTDEGEEQSHVLSSPSERGVDETETTDKGVSKTTDADQKKLQNNIRDDISSLISAYLKKYLLTGSTAFLVQAASRALETEKKDSSGIVDSQKKIRLSPELLSTAASKLLDKDTLSQTLYLKDEDNRHYKERLHDIWEKVNDFKYFHFFS